MPKDGQGSSSSFVEVEFEHQRQRTSVKHKDLNPVWNERLVFAVSDPADLPYRAIDVGVYNERSSASSRNFLGRVRISAAGVPAPGEEPVPQLFSLEKRSLFSHIRGEISLKIYRAHANDIREAGGNQTVAKVKEVGPELHPSGRKQQQHQQQPVGGQVAFLSAVVGSNIADAAVHAAIAASDEVHVVHQEDICATKAITDEADGEGCVP